MTEGPKYNPDARKGRMNRSRLIAAGTSVGAFVAISAGVAAANPAPSASASIRRSISTVPGGQRQHDNPGQEGGANGAGSDQFRPLPPDGTFVDPGTSGRDGAPTFDPSAGPGLDAGNSFGPPADTRSGGS